MTQPSLVDRLMANPRHVLAARILLLVQASYPNVKFDTDPIFSATLKSSFKFRNRDLRATAAVLERLETVVKEIRNAV